MDKRIRRNEYCVVGQPRCDFAFSSTRMCFIGYGFKESALEMSILKKLLEEKGIQPSEAGGSLLSGQNAFCGKICSKIITSQFCIILLNNDKKEGKEIPNSNVNMEYGLMLGFNKYVIPFQRESQKLPFNVSGLDTVKYNNNNFESMAIKAIDQAILNTNQTATAQNLAPDQVLQMFLLINKALISPLNYVGEKDIFNLGNHLGFNLLNDFSGFKYQFLGNFTTLRPEVILWRLNMLQEILDGRRSSVNKKVALGLATQEQALAAEEIFKGLEIWLIASSNDDKKHIQETITTKVNPYKISVYSLEDVNEEMKKLA